MSPVCDSGREIMKLEQSELDRGLLYIGKYKTRKSCRWLRVPVAIWRILEPADHGARAEGRDRLFPFQTNWVRRHTSRHYVVVGECD